MIEMLVIDNSNSLVKINSVVFLIGKKIINLISLRKIYFWSFYGEKYLYCNKN